MPFWLWITLGVIISVVAVTAICWVTISYKTFPNRIKPGQTYEIEGRRYQVPNLPHKQYKSNETPSIDSEIPMLDTKSLADLRALVDDTFRTLDESGTEFWVTGGTLISAQLWGHLMCYDDDCDIAVNWKDREYIWSPEFATLLSLKGLETFTLIGASLEGATREGACMRVRRKNHIHPTLDIFFVREREDGKMARVNTWWGDKLTYDEVWDSRDWVYPLHKEEVDGMNWTIANKPEEMLDRQYGPEWKTTIQSPPPMTNSHEFAFRITNFFQVWKIGKILNEKDRNKLVNKR